MFLSVSYMNGQIDSILPGALASGRSKKLRRPGLRAAVCAMEEESYGIIVTRSVMALTWWK
jgi:hypothetical protein